MTLTTLSLLVVIAIALQIGFFIVNRLKLNKMADQNTVIEGLVTRINTDATTIKTMLNNVISNPANTISDESLADLNAAVSNLDALANVTASAPEAQA